MFTLGKGTTGRRVVRFAESFSSMSYTLGISEFQGDLRKDSVAEAKPNVQGGPGIVTKALPPRGVHLKDNRAPT